MNKLNKRKNLCLKLCVLALIALLALTVALVPWINRMITVDASVNSLPLTFLPTRSGAIRENSTAAFVTNEREFASFDFQRNSANFRYIPSVQGNSPIAGILDYSPQHGLRALYHQSRAIRNPEVNRSGTLTVMVHGQGGRASEWLN